MAELKYIGPHGPTEIRNVPDKLVEQFLKTGLYESINDNLIINKGVKEEEIVKPFLKSFDDEEE